MFLNLNPLVLPECGIFFLFFFWNYVSKKLQADLDSYKERDVYLDITEVWEASKNTLSLKILISYILPYSPDKLNTHIILGTDGTGEQAGGDKASGCLTAVISSQWPDTVKI